MYLTTGEEDTVVLWNGVKYYDGSNKDGVWLVATESSDVAYSNMGSNEKMRWNSSSINALMQCIKRGKKRIHIAMPNEELRALNVELDNNEILDVVHLLSCHVNLKRKKKSKFPIGRGTLEEKNLETKEHNNVHSTSHEIVADSSRNSLPSPKQTDQSDDFGDI